MVTPLPPPTNILVICVTRIGDTLAITPALQAIGVHWPDAKITVLGGRKRAEVLKHLPYIHTVGYISKNSAPLSGWLAPKKYDLAIVYNFDIELVKYAIRVSKRVIAYRQGDPRIEHQLYDHKELVETEIGHLTDIGSNRVRHLGIAVNTGRIQYTVTPQETAHAKSMLADAGLSGVHPLIGLQPVSFATKSYRNWPLGHFKSLCLAIMEQWPNSRFIIFGGPDDSSLVSALANDIGMGAVSLAGKLTLRETGAMMSLLDTYIGVDTGPTHLMSSFDIPIIGLYHSRHKSHILGPKDHPFNFSIDHPYPDDKNGQPRPMSDITVERVLESVNQALASFPKGEPS